MGWGYIYQCIAEQRFEEIRTYKEINFVGEDIHFQRSLTNATETAYVNRLVNFTEAVELIRGFAGDKAAQEFARNLTLKYHA